MAQVGRLGPKVGSHLALLCIHRVNRGTRAIKIVLGVIRPGNGSPMATNVVAVVGTCCCY